uniref:Fgf receptor activating protein n=1 Tax=Papilio xuthus TaxID=66420 RepID=I4DKP4_PAPXU|nr:post-GPI attachment to proteins factor 2-like [Papilio xuthus]BAM18484.1 fgf receptor activating protein [Papilio xuthus]
MYLPLYNVYEKRCVVRISVSKLGFFTVLLPLLAFIMCIILTMYKDFDRANHTHCNVPNIFPSISASIGNYEPQRTIWKTAIYIHAPIRFFIIYLRWKYYREIILDTFSVIVNVAVSLNVIENLSLVGLSYWTSSLNYPFHEVCFKTFIGTSIFYMLLTSVLVTQYRRKSHMTRLERNSVKLKWRAFSINVVSFTIAAYLFIRHNRLCEPYVYSMFGFSEYIVVFSNIAFHMTTVYDLERRNIYLSTRGIRLE